MGDTVMFEVTIKNRGDAPARDFRVSFRDTSSVWPALEKMVSGEVGPGQSSTVNFRVACGCRPTPVPRLLPTLGQK